MKLELGSLTDCGKIREGNEDSLGVFEPPDPAVREQKGCLCVVADGLGGFEAGEVASALAVATMREYYFAPASGGKIEQSLRKAVQAANLRIFDEGQGALTGARRMETTLTAIVFARATAYLAHVGDSRLYMVRDGAARRLTTDHSQVGDMMRLGLLTAEEARQHPYRHLINRSLGAHPLVHPDFQRVPMRVDDYYVLCSDGLWSEIQEQELVEAVVDRKPQEACETLGELVLGREAADNLTVVVAHVLEVDSTPAPEGRLVSFLRRTGLRAGAEDDQE